ncbi:MAG: hypothetical protein JJ863_24425 [Deltaproteobacteria bacterium]|nr:hypothetical protein [Deltaproteobacteria bacterium]
MTAEPEPKLLTRVRADLILAVATAAVFARGLGHGLMTSWDDQRFLVDFEPIQTVSWDHFVAIWSGPHFEAYHPLHLLSYWIDVPLFGPHGPTLHVVSLGLWIGAALVWMRVFRALGLREWAAFFGALFFAIHPIQIEAVHWATGRKDVLAALFAGLATLAHLKSERWSDRASILSLLAFAAAALSKTTVLPLPIVWVLMDGVLERRTWRDAGLRQIPATALAAVLAFVALGIWQDAEMVREPLEGFGRVSLVASSYGHHLGHAVFPYDLSPIYPIHREAPVWSAWFGPIVLVVAAVAAGRRGKRFELLGLLTFAVLLVPASNVVPLYFEVQDRYLSLPLIGLALMVAAMAGELAGRRFAGAGLFLAAYAAATVFQLGHWRSDEALWASATHAQPQAFYAWMKLGEVRRGDGDFAGALRAYDRAIDLEPRLALGVAARFQTEVLRDEHEYSLTPSHAEAITQRFLQGQGDPVALRRLSGDMVQEGYRESVFVPLGRALELAPIPDGRLAAAARSQLEQGNAWLAGFYVDQMSDPPQALREQVNAARN